MKIVSEVENWIIAFSSLLWADINDLINYLLYSFWYHLQITLLYTPKLIYKYRLIRCYFVIFNSYEK